MARRTTVEQPTPPADAFGQAFGDTQQTPDPEPTRRDSKKVKQPKAPKPSRRDRKAVPAPGAVKDIDVAKAVQARKKALSTGTRYNGDRRKWALLGAGLVLIPVVSLTSFIVAVNRPSNQQVIDIVEEQLSSRGTEFPSGEAVAWAAPVVRDWATWDEADDTGLREANLSQALSQGMDASAGWNGKGKQSVVDVSVNPTPKVVDDTRALIDATYKTDAGTWRCLTLSVFTYKPEGLSAESKNAFALTANPTPVACPPRTGAPALEDTPLPGYGDDDQANAEILTSQFFPGFFAAWAASDSATLGQYTTTDTRLIGLGGAFESSPNPIIDSVALPQPINVDGTPRTDDTSAVWIATVGVTWTIPDTGTQITSSYEVELRKNGNQWQVTKEPEPITQQKGLSGAPLNSTMTGETGALSTTTN